MGGRAWLGALLLALLACGAEARAGEGRDELLEGFEDEPAGDGEDPLGGFDEEDSESARPSNGSPLHGEWWQLTGSVSLASSINFLPHRSATGPPPDPTRGTDYLGLSKLRTRLNLQLDAELPRGWELRAQGFGYYDWAYLIRGRDDYTNFVLDQYEWDADTQDFWIRGSPFENVDVKVGRQVVNWGRSESLRVLDVLNPLDNREPGIADIEDLRRAVTMGRFDFYHGAWNLSLLAIPEIRFGQNPPIGSDFNPVTPDLLAVPIVQPKPNSLENWEAGVGLTGIFEGWDLSFHFAYTFDDFAVLETIPTPADPVARLVHSRLWLVGSGGNYTIGSWLLKGEIAYVDGVLFTDAGTRSRLDVMLGVEYYGFTDTTISIELLNRHTFDFPATPTIGTTGFVPQENESQGAFRLTRSFFRERLDATVVAVLLSGESEVGSVVRIDGSYELRDALVLTAGFVLYQESDLPPLSTYGNNDRFFFELKYSF